MSAHTGQGLGRFGRTALRRLRRSLHDDLSRNPVYREMALRGPAPSAATAVFAEIRPVDASRAQALAQGVFAWGGRRWESPVSGSIFDIMPEGDPAFAWLHEFSWLTDLTAEAAGADGPRMARALVNAWITRFGRWHDQAWTPGVTARRVLSWLAAGDALFPLDDPRTADRLESLARQARRLETDLPLTAPNAERLSAAIAVAAAGLCAPELAPMTEKGLVVLAEALDEQIHADGGHISRSPQVCADVLADLAALQNTLVVVGRGRVAHIDAVAQKLAAIVASFTGPDGGLAAFQSGGEGDRALLKALGRRWPSAAPFGVAPRTGYMRIDAGGGVLTFDTGPAPTADVAPHAALGYLAFEFASSQGRLIVNSGWSREHDRSDKADAQTCCAHSTVCLGERPPTRLAATFPPRRNEEARGVWVDGGHDGYAESFGLAHRRRVFMDASGGDVRGEDTLFAAETGRSAKAADYAIRFHLHPDVRVTPAKDGRSAMLTLPGGEGWRLRTDVPPLDVEPSRYFAAGAPARDTTQLVISGRAEPKAPIDAPPNRVRWALQRIGRSPGL